jgi:hypothetical protein
MAQDVLLQAIDEYQHISALMIFSLCKLSFTSLQGSSSGLFTSGQPVVVVILKKTLKNCRFGGQTMSLAIDRATVKV